MPLDLSGKWGYVREDNLVEFMEKFNPASVGRLLAHGSSRMQGLIMEVDQDGDHIRMTSRVGSIVRIQDIIVGEECDQYLPSEKKMKAVSRWDADKLVIDGVDEEGRNIKVTWEIVNDEQVLVTLFANGLSTKRYYKRV